MSVVVSTQLIERGKPRIGVLLVSFLVAAFWGAAHALTPGHGKAMVAAYLVGTKGTPTRRCPLGGTVTVAHTAGVFALGFVTLGLSTVIVPEQLYPWLTLVSGAARRRRRCLGPPAAASLTGATATMSTTTITTIAITTTATSTTTTTMR